MTSMTTTDFFTLWAALLATMLACRCIPLFALRHRALSQSTTDALSLIPPAAFAALVANDLLTPGMFAQGFWPAALPLVAAGIVAVVAWRSKSLVWSAVAGIAAYAALSMIGA